MRKQESGFTLIELLISIALSMIFISGAVTFLVSSRGMANLQESSSRIQENALYVLDELSASIRMAGHYNLLAPGAQIPAGQFYTGKCGTYDPCTADGTDAATNYSDRIAVMLNPPEDDGTDGDCVGNVIHTNAYIATTSVVANLYRVENIDGMNTLVCESFLIDRFGAATSITDTPYQLVSGVESLQILYGITDMSDVNEINNTIARYISANAVSAAPAPIGATSAWVDISTVRLAVLSASGFNDNSGSTMGKSYDVLDAQTVTTPDKNLRKIYTSTVLINNSRM